jgi:FixJ family two-component response regulator
VCETDAPLVCLVDDDASVRKSVGRLLESSGYRVAPFGEPEAFLSYLSTHPVPVLILDIWMEKMTGMQVLTYLCAQSPETRVIFITGHKDHAAEAVVKQAGAFAFFMKPLDDAPFLAAVNRAFKRSSAGQ